MAEAIDNDPAVPSGSGGLAELSAALAQAEEKVRQQHEQYLRAAAELDNVRKRAQRDIESAHRYALERFAAELLPVRDSLELGVQSGAQADAKSMLAGQEATLKLLERAGAAGGAGRVGAQRTAPATGACGGREGTGGIGDWGLKQRVGRGNDLKPKAASPI
jgi:hypothetical protein